MRVTQSVRASILGLVCSSALLQGGCLVEYVLPGDPISDTGDATATMATTGATSDGTGDAGASADTGATGDAPTGGDTSDTPQPCAEGQLRCGEGCVDPRTDEANCGACGDPCKSDELCIVGECRDVQVVACEGCPCPDLCPQGDGDGDGVLASTTSGGDGDVPDRRLCCVVAEPDQQPTVLCVSGDLDDELVCPP